VKADEESTVASSIAAPTSAARGPLVIMRDSKISSHVFARATHLMKCLNRQ
jgi:hypothetical protein